MSIAKPGDREANLSPSNKFSRWELTHEGPKLVSDWHRFIDSVAIAGAEKALGRPLNGDEFMAVYKSVIAMVDSLVLIPTSSLMGNDEEPEPAPVVPIRQPPDQAQLDRWAARRQAASDAT